ncbi:BTAD domain-containing putative transcriptional regulator [Pseudonocardia sp.]|uniref:BTAD domain-containing putative transcriptional regulator n=1 Tax=Pseudonocardia sp. TaxID=60912 RepID=UPI00260EE16D|nr:BTAD domain-containing putative transcriptional regulator [Pseudonocardia sp.]
MTQHEVGRPVGVVPRLRLGRLLDAAVQRRVTLVVAGGGFGKTTVLRELADRRQGEWLAVTHADRAVEVLADRMAAALGASTASGPPRRGGAVGAEDRRGLAESRAGLLCESVERSGMERTLVVDDLERLGDDDSATELLRALCLQAPPALHLVLSGRRLPGLAIGRLRVRGEVAEVSAADLAFTVEETAALLVDRLGAQARGLAQRCWRVTAGWAAALQLTIDRLERLDPDRRPAALDQWRRHAGTGWREFATDLLAAEPAATRRVLAVASVSRVVDAELLAGVGVPVTEWDLEELHDRGLLASVGGAGTPTPEARVVSPVLVEVAASLLDEAEAAVLRGAAAHWLERAQRWEEALECRAAGPPAETRAMLARCGYVLVGRGYGGRVAEVLSGAETDVDDRMLSLLGAALQAAGDWDGALEAFGRLRRGPGGELAPEAAWRYGALLYLRGDAEGALRVLASGDRPAAAGADGALVAAWLATTLWSRGDVDGAQAAAARASTAAGLSGDPAARAAAHVAQALVAASRGDRDRNAAEYRLALAAAAAAGDTSQIARIHANLSSRALEEGDYPGAVRHADLALSDGAGHLFFSALALSNKADALIHTGRLDTAGAVLDQAVEAYGRLGSLRVGIPRALLGTVHHERGDLVRARASFEQAVRLAEQTQDVHAAVTAATGLAPVVAGEDPHAARAVAAGAVAAASSLELPSALCAAAYVEFRAGDRPAAAGLARRAEAEARVTGDRAALAEALELAAVAVEPADLRLLQASIAVWDDVGNPIAAARTRLTAALCRGDRVEADAARRELAGHGASPEVGTPSLLAARLAAPAREPVEVTTLGRFRLLRGGVPLTTSAWQSRKARDLLKILIAHHGRPITRDAAADALWPGEASPRLPNRLSVALSTLRRVLDPDRVHPADHYLAADDRSIALRTERVRVDVVEFRRLAEEGVALAADGQAGAAEQVLRRAVRLYAGDFLEEDRFCDWAVDCREAARATVQTVSRLLARQAAQRGDEETAVRHLWRLLERDPYDEDAWQAALGTLLRLGRRGHARQLYSTYVRRMAELGVAPLPLSDAETRRA